MTDIKSTRKLAERVLLEVVSISPVPTPMIYNLEYLIKKIGVENNRETVDQVGAYIAREGWGTVNLHGLRLQGPRASVKFNQQAFVKAQELLNSMEKTSILQKMHGINWATWGGIASLVGAVIAAVALYMGLN